MSVYKLKACIQVAEVSGEIHGETLFQTENESEARAAAIRWAANWLALRGGSDDWIACLTLFRLKYRKKSCELTYGEGVVAVKPRSREEWEEFVGDAG